jgi:hypothetical protein
MDDAIPNVSIRRSAFSCSTANRASGLAGRRVCVSLSLSLSFFLGGSFSASLSLRHALNALGIATQVDNNPRI